MGPQLLKEIIRELNEECSGGVVSKVHQSDERNVILRVFIRGRDYRLLLSAHHRFSRIHLTEYSFFNPPSPLRFCAYLRKRITNARIEGFTQAEGERIVRIGLKKRSDDTAEDLTLVCELTGKSANIILVDNAGVVLDALKHFPPETSVRAVEPGLKLDPLPKREGGAEKEEAITREAGETWNSAADRHYSALIKDEGLTSDKGSLKRAITEAEKRLRRKLANLEGDRSRAEEGLESYKTGELLTANFGRLKKGLADVEAMDYTKDPPQVVSVRLDEKLSPKENIEKYFKRAKKAKVALNLLKQRIPAVQEELEYMEQLKYEWDAAASSEDVEALRDEMSKGGYIKVEKARDEKAALERAEPVRRFTSTEGFEILCGKSGPANDMLVQRYASNEDIWFHVHHLPGSHVIIKVAGRGGELTKKTIEEAAGIAAYFSKAQNAGKVEVIYTEARFVRKPRGAKPGMVTVKEYKSVMVRPTLPAGEEE